MVGTALGGFRRLARALALLAAGVLLASCSDLPAKPLPLVTAAGTVLDREGSPLGGFRLDFIPTGLKPHEPVPAAPQSGRAYTDGAGAFSVTLYTGDYDVFLEPIFPGEYGGALVHGVRISAARPRFDYRFAGVRLGGEIRGPGGVPLTGARVRAYQLGGDYDSRSAESADGRYAMVMPPGVWDIFAIPPYSLEGLPTLGLGLVQVGADTTIDISLTGEAVTATVTGQSALPVSGAQVSLSATSADCSGTTVSDGTALLHVPAGDYHGYLRPPSGQSYIATRSFPVSVTGPMALALDLWGVVWTGQVTYTGSGLLAAGAPVSASSMSSYSSYAYATTGAAGTFHLVLVPGNVYALRIGALEVGWFGAAGDTTLDFSVDSAAVWSSNGGASAAAGRRVTFSPSTRRPRPR